jgi:hypothetical protein
MSLRVLCISVILLVFLAACQSPTGGVVINQVPTGPRDIVVNGSPNLPVPVNPQPAPKKVVVSSPVPEVIIIPETKPAEDPYKQCMDSCSTQCKASAEKACSQNLGTECRANCGGIIDKSACSTACSLRNANACEPKFIEFCSNKCVERCN